MYLLMLYPFKNKAVISMVEWDKDEKYLERALKLEIYTCNIYWLDNLTFFIRDYDFSIAENLARIFLNENVEIMMII